MYKYFEFRTFSAIRIYAVMMSDIRYEMLTKKDS